MTNEQLEEKANEFIEIVKEAMALAEIDYQNVILIDNEMLEITTESTKDAFKLNYFFSKMRLKMMINRRSQKSYAFSGAKIDNNIEKPKALH